MIKAEPVSEILCTSQGLTQSTMFSLIFLQQELCPRYNSHNSAQSKRHTLALHTEPYKQKYGGFGHTENIVVSCRPET